MEDFWMFALAGLLLNLTPGNDMLYVAARSTGQGAKAGIVSALGIAGGCTIHMLAAVAGLSALIANSAIAFMVVKYVGAAYLIFLGFQSLLKRKKIVVETDNERLAYPKVFWQGVLTNVLNPKVALFFLAFLPQFIDIRSGNTIRQILFLGTWFNFSGLVVNVTVALLFARIRYWFSSTAVRWQQRFTGGVLILLGIKMAVEGKN